MRLFFAVIVSLTPCIANAQQPMPPERAKKAACNFAITWWEKKFDQQIKSTNDRCQKLKYAVSIREGQIKAMMGPTCEPIMGTVTAQLRAQLVDFKRMRAQACNRPI